MEKVLIWIDDERSVPENLDKRFLNIQVCKSYMQAIIALDCLCNDGWEVYISFDHDLGGRYTGYDIAKYIVSHGYDVAGFRCHSMNPVGKRNIEQLLEHYGYEKF